MGLVFEVRAEISGEHMFVTRSPEIVTRESYHGATTARKAR
jgi:hypothetical protein